MSIYAVVTVDLDGGVTSAQRAKFNRYLEERYYKQHKLTTLWTVSFTPTSTKTRAKALVRLHVDEAARFAGITHYEVLFCLSDEPPVEWTKGGFSPALGAAGLVDYNKLLSGLSGLGLGGLR